MSSGAGLPIKHFSYQDIAKKKKVFNKIVGNHIIKIIKYYNSK